MDSRRGGHRGRPTAVGGRCRDRPTYPQARRRAWTSVRAGTEAGPTTVGAVAGTGPTHPTGASAQLDAAATAREARRAPPRRPARAGHGGPAYCDDERPAGTGHAAWRWVTGVGQGPAYSATAPGNDEVVERWSVRTRGRRARSPRRDRTRLPSGDGDARGVDEDARLTRPCQRAGAPRSRCSASKVRVGQGAPHGLYVRAAVGPGRCLRTAAVVPGEGREENAGLGDLREPADARARRSITRGATPDPSGVGLLPEALRPQHRLDRRPSSPGQRQGAARSSSRAFPVNTALLLLMSSSENTRTSCSRVEDLLVGSRRPAEQRQKFTIASEYRGAVLHHRRAPCRLLTAACRARDERHVAKRGGVRSLVQEDLFRRVQTWSSPRITSVIAMSMSSTTTHR